jgi:hypothetical protein
MRHVLFIMIAISLIYTLTWLSQTAALECLVMCQILQGYQHTNPMWETGERLKEQTPENHYIFRIYIGVFELNRTIDKNAYDYHTDAFCVVMLDLQNKMLKHFN